MNNRLKALALRSVARMQLICEKEYPIGSVRMLVWFTKSRGLMSYERTPVICDGDLPDKVLRIENQSDFACWGLNPWTGEKADIQIQF